ncbi:hypothetical protein GCM10010987_78680 [Bradyrhizobium guangdongense]|uniref:Uncharacterized protein n=1 Tax=Bradyrhizobium guangdongense TaxID=1325090 RepID=A0AA87WEN2_9BRAD|nr:hypothetical protein GCM10010987_78680 [Bradyrhizobium guangdongense]
MPELSAVADRQGRSKRYPAGDGRHRRLSGDGSGRCPKARLRVLQQDAIALHVTSVGVQRSFAETVDAYIERKLADE